MNSYNKLKNENERLKVALDYICLLSNIKNHHLGRPRLSDKKCIFCMAYFAINNGAFGEEISIGDYKKFKEELLNE